VRADEELIAFAELEAMAAVPSELASDAFRPLDKDDRHADDRYESFTSGRPYGFYRAPFQNDARRRFWSLRAFSGIVSLSRDDCS